jgi:hypothetical protein
MDLFVRQGINRRNIQRYGKDVQYGMTGNDAMTYQRFGGAIY